MDIGSLTGQIEIEDQVTGVLGMITQKVAAFAEDFGGAFGAAAAAVGLVTAAVTGAAAAITALGSRGADVNDVTATFEKFSGGVDKALANMKALQAGTLETVDKFDLMKSSSKLLAAGVKLTADDFGTLSGAAFVLQNQGLGPTKDMLNLVSQAMLTGRTRSLEMTLGKMHLKDAEKDYAASIGKTVKDLDEVEKLEAKRQGILDALAKKVKEAGVQQRDFGEQLEFVQAKIKDWFDDIASAVANSAALTAGMQVLTDAIAEAFGGDQKSLIDGVVSAVETAADLIMDVGLAAVEAARVGVTAWSALKWVILGSLEMIAAQTAKNAHLIAGLLGLAALVPGASSSIGTAAKAASSMAQELESLDAGLKKETDAAWLGVTGHSELHKTLDKIGGVIFRVKDAMDQARKSTEGHTTAVKKDDDAVKDHVGQLTEYEKKLVSIADSLTGKDAVKAAQDYVKVLKVIPDVSLLTSDAQKKIASTMQAAIDVYEAAGETVPQTWRDIALATSQVTDETHKLTDAVTAMWAALPVTLKSRDISSIVPQIDVGAMQGNFQQVVAALNKTLKGVSLADALLDDVQRIPGMVASAFTGGGGFGGALQGIGSMLASTLGKHIGEGVSSLGKMGGPIGAAIGSLAGSVIEKIVSLFATAGRDAIKAFGKEMTGTNDLNALHTLLQQQLPEEAEKYWIILTQGTGRNNPEQAAANIQKVRDALANSPAAQASAAGYKTMEELQEIADKAKAVYDYMAASGKYSASAMADAFAKMAEAQAEALGQVYVSAKELSDKLLSIMSDDEVQALASSYKTALAEGFKGSQADFLKQQLEFYSTLAEGDERLKTYFYGSTVATWKLLAMGQGDVLDEITARYKTAFDKLGAEYKSLSDSVNGEAEEAYMGVVETQQRARMAQIEEERKHLDEKKTAELTAAAATYDEWLKAGKTTDETLRELFQKPYKIPIEWVPGEAPGQGGARIPSESVTPRFNSPAPAAQRAGQVRIQFPGSTMAELVVPFIPGVIQDFNLG